MGVCASRAETAEEQSAAKRSRKIDAQIKEIQNGAKGEIKVLLLGAGESGKSTVLKQMICLYGTGFSEEERKEFAPIVHHNTVESIQMLITQAPRYGDLSPEIRKLAQLIMELKENFEGHYHLRGVEDSIEQIWKDETIQITYKDRKSFQLHESAKYFLDKVKEIQAVDYVPSVDDVFRTRIRTTHIVEQEFMIDENKFKFYDVGGQRSERRKWIHCFEDVTAVLYISGISSYDQVLFEDETKNRMEESLEMFHSICSLKYFVSSSIILFMNKFDLFIQKNTTIQF